MLGANTALAGSGMNTAGYRPDIDGLRTISVVSVLCYHYGFGPFTGGFVGVDVFFVISGYLITSIIFREMQQGRFSLLGFYDRRVRRILPATLLTIIATAAAGYFVLLPSDYAAFGESAAYASFGVANFYFLWNTGGYFDSRADLMPLLHMWSLAVEEQFYFLWPILLMAVFSLSRGSRYAIAGTLAAIVVISFSIAVWTVNVDRQLAFYMIQSRAWELAIGAAVAFLPAMSSRPAGEVLSIAGIGLISFGVFGLTSQSPFPGWNAVYPCVGAALLVWPQMHRTVVARALSFPPMVFIGKISFSLYLWHWPLLVLYRHHGLGEMPPLADRIWLAAIAVVLAAASWWLVEEPFRRRRPRQIAAVASGLAAMSATAALAAAISLNGFSWRLPAEAREYENHRSIAVAERTLSPCFLTTGTEKKGITFDKEKCVDRSPAKARVLIIGDSHADHLVPGLRTVFPDISFSQITASGCLPVLPLKGGKRCTQLMRLVLDKIAPEEKFDEIVISANWRLKTPEPLEKLVAKLSPHSRVTILGPSIKFTAPLPVLLAKSVLDHRDLVNGHAKKSFARKQTKEVSRAAARSGASFFDLLDINCPGGRCVATTADNVPIMYDDDHFTRQGAEAIVSELKKRGFLSIYSSSLSSRSSRSTTDGLPPRASGRSW